MAASFSFRSIASVDFESTSQIQSGTTEKYAVSAMAVR
jgi:hypothetical protein